MDLDVVLLVRTTLRAILSLHFAGVSVMAFKSMLVRRCVFAVLEEELLEGSVTET